MNGRFAFALVVLMSFAVVGPRAYQQPQAAPARTDSAAQPGTAQLGGVVTSADGSEQPIRRAVVRISTPELRGSREIATDDRGRFLFTELPAGRYQISASKPGYVNTAYGQKRPRGAGTTLSLADGQKDVGLRMVMAKGAVVSGRVADEFGQPIPSVRISVFEKTTVNGQLALSMVSSNNAETDDRGTYRVYGLPAGAYIVSVSGGIRVAPVRSTTTAELQWAVGQATAPSSAGQYSAAPPAAQTVGVTQIFHPSATRASEAMPIEVEAGAERASVDITVRFVPVASVSGTVTTPGGGPVSGATAVLVGETPATEPGGSSMQNTRTNPRGEFSFPSTKSGQYKVMVQASSRTGGPLDFWGMTSVSVDGRDLSGVTVTLQPGMTVGGRIVIDPAATTQVPDLTTTRITLGSGQQTGASFGVAAATIAADGSFTMTGAAPGSYRMAVGPPLRPNRMGDPYVWVTKSVTLNGREVLERPFDIGPGENIDGVVITLTDRVTSLSGKLIDAQGKPGLDYFVIVLPADRTFWVQGLMGSPRSARPANDGSFRFNALPPGEYYIGATTDYQSRDLYDAAFLAQLMPTAVKLTIAGGEKKIQDLKIAGR